MKKNKLFQLVVGIVFLFIFFSCQTPGPDSSWNELKNTQDVKCLAVEHTNEILGIRELKSVDHGSMFIESIDRSGRIGYWQAQLNKNVISSKFKKLDLQDRPLSSVERFFTDLRAYAYVDKDFKVKLLTESQDKIAEYELLTEDLKCSFEDTMIESIKVVGHSDLVWVSVVLRCQDELNLSVSLIDTKAKSQVRSFSKKNISDSYREWFVTDDNNLLFVSSSPKEDSGVFYIYQFGDDGFQQSYSIRIKEYIENWSATYKNNSLYLATVQGDSMIGEASLVVDKYQLKPSIESKKKEKLEKKEDNTSTIDNDKDKKDDRTKNKNININKNTKKEELILLKSELTGGSSIPLAHLSSPVWLNSEEGLSVLIFKWLDNESTVGSYSIEETRVKDSYSLTLKQLDLGIFPNSSRIEKVYSMDKKDYMVIKTQNNYFGEFSICKLK